MSTLTFTLYPAPAVQELINGIQGSDAAARATAINEAAKAGPEAISPLANVMGSANRAAAKAAREALERLALYAGRPGSSGDAGATSAELVKLIGRDRPAQVRVEALRLLGCVGGAEAVPAIVRQLTDPRVREEARLALIRIPDPNVDRLLRASRRTTPPEFHPALEQALQQRAGRAMAEEKKAAPK